MKHIVVACMCLILLVLFCVPAIAQPSTKSVETIILDNFDNEGAQDYLFHGSTYNWTWRLQASRFVTSEKDSNGNVTDSYPKSGYFSAVPNSLRPLQAEGADPKVFGVQAKFDRKGDNWFEILPCTTDDSGEETNFEIPLSGLVKQIDFWVWGANYKYVLELMVRDADGRVNVLRATDLSFNGWRNVIVNIPSSIRQQSRLRSGPQNLTVVGFRVRSDPSEYVDDFMIFFDQLKYTSHTLNNIFDGFELKYADFGEQDSSYSSNSSSSGPSVDAK